MFLLKRVVDVGDGADVDVLDDEAVSDDVDEGDDEGVDVLFELAVAIGGVDTECDPAKVKYKPLYVEVALETY